LYVYICMSSVDLIDFIRPTHTKFSNNKIASD